MAYATVSDLMQRWRLLSDAEQARAEVMLDDAATILDATVDIDEDDARQAALLKTVSCSMVKRAMVSMSDGMLGVAQGTISADIYSQTFQFSNPGGDMYLTQMEKRLLGVTNSYIGSIPAAVGWCR